MIRSPSHVLVCSVIGCAGLLAAGSADATPVPAGIGVDVCVADSGGGALGGSCGDGGPATAALLSGPTIVAPTLDGGFLIFDSGNHVIRRVSRQGVITRIAGTGVYGHTGDGGPATGARLAKLTCMTQLADGSVLVDEASDPSAQLPPDVREISPAGTITTVEGRDACSPAVLADGERLVVADNRVERLAGDGTATVVAGNGGCSGSMGDGVPAVGAELGNPAGVAGLPDGGFLIADADHNLVRRVSPTGTITTVAGSRPPELSVPGTPYCLSPEETPGVPNFLEVSPVRAKAGQSFTVSITSTFAGDLTLRISRAPRSFHPPRLRAVEGPVRSTLNPRLRRGLYVVTVTNSGTYVTPRGDTQAFTKTATGLLTIS